MFKHETKIVTRYAEVDRMGYVYYGNYATYFEVARVETMKEFGLSYSDLEDAGILMPVVHYEIDYKKPAFYDEELTVVCTIKELPRSRMNFFYETYNQKGWLLNSAMTQLVFVSTETNRPTKAPDQLLAALEKVMG